MSLSPTGKVAFERFDWDRVCNTAVQFAVYVLDGELKVGDDGALKFILDSVDVSSGLLPVRVREFVAACAALIKSIGES